MRDRFRNLLGIDGVKGVFFFSASGQRVFEEFTVGRKDVGSASDWFALAASLDNAREAELVFEKARLYIRRSAEGVLLVVTGLIAPTGMVRLASDLLLSDLKEQKSVRGIKRFFKR